MQKTVIVGSTPKQYKYAYTAAERLKSAGHPFIPVGIQEGEVLGEPILLIHDQPKIEHVHTITLYIQGKRQKDWYAYLLSLAPKRIIFNPGAENQEFKELAEKEGVKCEEACTLVMLSIGNY